MKILIVDDMEVNLEMLEARLEGSGYEVASAKNGIEALEILKTDSFDMIISDILMPKMDGFQLCRECKKDDTLRKIPFIFYTATYTDKKDEEFALSLGAEKFIVKPMENKRFMEIIEGILKNYKKGLLAPSEMPVEEEPIYLKEYNERLIKKLEDKMLDLEEANRGLRESENTLQKQAHDLGERVKELNCLYGISHLIEKPGISLGEVIQGTIDLMPSSWQYPEITCGRIIMGTQEYRTENFRETMWTQTSDITVHDERIGTAEVYYLEEVPERDDGHFLKEETNLINAISERLGKTIERIRGEERINHLNAVLRSIRGVNQLIVKEKKIDRLVKGACENIIETRGYYRAWIALLDESGGIVETAEAGFGKDFLPVIKQLKRGEMPDCARKALSQSDVVVTKDPVSTCVDCLLSAQYSDMGAMTVRLEHEGKVYGVFCVSIPKDFLEDEEEQSLFKEVAGDIAFASHGIELAEERKQAEEALRESEEKFRELFDGSDDSIFVVNPQTRKLVDCNKQAQKITGYSRKEILSMRADQLHPKDKVKKTMEGFKKHAAGELLFVESEVLTKDKKRVPVSISSSLVEIAGEKYLQGIFRDITERKQAEQKIQEYSQNLERMVEERTKELNRALYDTEAARDRIDGILKSVADGLIVTDIYNRIILMNRAAEDLMGVRFSEVIDRPIDFAIKDKTLRDRIKTTLDKKKEEYEFDFGLPGEDTTHPRIMRARTSVIKDRNGKHTGIVTIIHDVTYEREVDRIKTEFLSTAAHELRTPLTSIQGFSEILLTRDDIKEEEKEECLSYINKQSVNLAAIINDLLDISRIESGKGFTLNKAPCNIADIIKDTIPYFQTLFPKHNFDVVVPEESVELMVDKEKMGQVLENILSNAVKYSPEGGSICLTAKRIAEFGVRNADLKEEEKYSAIEISVADQGIGMTSEQVEKIFDKFYRVDASNTAIPGTGLGMNIVQYLVEAHGGEVWVESELGKGTTVKFVIPI